MTELKLRIPMDFDKCYHRKPNNIEVIEISNNLTHMTVEATVQILSQLMVKSYGRSWCPARFTGESRNNKSFLKQQLFALDFDSGITLEETIDRCEQLNTFPVFAYSTFSSVRNNKFRVVFLLEHEVADVRVRNLVQLALMKIFPECDKACKDPSRLFFGGKELIYGNYDARINIPELIDNMVIYINSKDENNNSSRTIKDYCQSVGVNMVNGLPDIKYLEADAVSENDVKTSSPIIYYRICGNNVKKVYCITFGKETITSPDKNKYPVTNTKVPRSKVTRNYNWDELEENCLLYKGHINGTYWSYYPELFGMATNLLTIECGRENLVKV